MTNVEATRTRAEAAAACLRALVKEYAGQGLEEHALADIDLLVGLVYEWTSEERTRG